LFAYLIIILFLLHIVYKMPFRILCVVSPYEFLSLKNRSFFVVFVVVDDDYDDDDDDRGDSIDDSCCDRNYNYN